MVIRTWCMKDGGLSVGLMKAKETVKTSSVNSPRTG
jgi:hypothetical protein